MGRIGSGRRGAKIGHGSGEGSGRGRSGSPGRSPGTGASRDGGREVPSSSLRGHSMEKPEERIPRCGRDRAGGAGGIHGGIRAKNSTHREWVRRALRRIPGGSWSQGPAQLRSRARRTFGGRNARRRIPPGTGRPRSHATAPFLKGIGRPHASSPPISQAQSSPIQGSWPTRATERPPTDERSPGPGSWASSLRLSRRPSRRGSSNSAVCSARTKGLWYTRSKRHSRASRPRTEPMKSTLPAWERGRE